MKSINSRMLKLIQLSLLFSFLLMTTFGCSKHETKDNGGDTINSESAKEKWTKTKDGRNYAFEYRESFFGILIYDSYRVLVDGENDQILRVQGINSGDLPVEINVDLQSYLTIDKIFAKIDELRAGNPASLEVEYYDNGAVKSYYVDHDVRLADDEYGLIVSAIVFQSDAIPMPKLPGPNPL